MFHTKWGLAFFITTETQSTLREEESTTKDINLGIAYLLKYKIQTKIGAI